MKKVFLLLTVLLLSHNLWAQETDSTENHFVTPDFRLIYRNCSDTSSNFYYPKLISRFAQVDTTLTLAELQAFYYGQAFQPNYAPYGLGREQFDRIRAIMSKEEEPTRVDFDSIVYYADQVIADHPAEPMAYYYKFIGLNAIYQYDGGDTLERNKAQLQFQMLFYTIESTGNGISTSQPFYVVSTSHEYMMLNMYGFAPKGQALISDDDHSFDLIYLQENEYGVDSLYFNIDLLFNHLSQLFANSFDPTESVTSVELSVGTKFVLELNKTKRKESTFRILVMEKVTDTLYSGDPKLFPDTIPENQVVGYFAPTRLSDNKSGKVFTCLLFKSNAKKDMLFMDTQIRYGSFSDYESTSNSGIPRGVLMNEMWPSTVTSLLISNIRTQEKKP